MELDRLDELKILTGESDERLLSLLVSRAERYVMRYTNRSMIIPALEGVVTDLALIAYNRMGTEGESSRSEAGESYSFDAAPKEVYAILNQYRLARCGGYAHEEISDDDVPSTK
ncbi:phage head-tail connector protein [Hominibacterium faecale]|uniref:phage head-tail connector protein n=1 Tax=Hominibacterium faecale TaxID=2839743 RepID=UPI0022B2A89F|nr:phage head-tail connector protein [Hominibacterium faecale]